MTLTQRLVNNLTFFWSDVNNLTSTTKQNKNKNKNELQKYMNLIQL